MKQRREVERPPHQLSDETDARELQKLGYKQQLNVNQAPQQDLRKYSN